MDFKHKSPSSVTQNGNYMEHIHRSPYNQDSMLHHINASPKEHQHHYSQHSNVYDYSNKYLQQHKNYYQQRSPVSHRLRRRCRSECLSPSGSPRHYYQYEDRYSNGRSSHNGYHLNNHEQELWRMQRRSEEREFNYQQQSRHEFFGVDGYKFKFNNLQIDGKSMGIHSEDPSIISDEIDEYDAWTQHRRRMRARSESAASAQDYYINFTNNSSDTTQDMKRISKEKKSRAPHPPSPSSHHSMHHHPQQHHHFSNNVTNSNPKANFSVLVNNTNHYRYSLSPKTKIRSHHLVGNKIRVSSPLHKARLQMWKNQNQNSASSSLPSTESNTPTTASSSSSKSIKGEIENDDDDELDDDDDDEPPPNIIDANDLIDDDMTDPEDNYESSLSLSSSDISSSIALKSMMTINTECVLATGRVTQQPLASSLFPFVPPYISFATFEDKGPDFPAMIHKVLKWKLTTITPLLVRKVLLNTGFRLMKSELIYLF